MNKFKVGDKVRIVREETTSAGNFSKHGIGYEFVISEIITNWCREDKDRSFGVHQDLLELVSSYKFKVGDKVKVIQSGKNSSASGRMLLGQTGIIRKVVYNTGNLKGPHAVLDIDTRLGGIYLDELEMITPSRDQDIYKIDQYYDLTRSTYSNNNYYSIDLGKTSGDWFKNIDIHMLNGYMNKESSNCIKSNNLINKPKNKFMNRITEFAKNMTLSQDEKTLRTVGLHDSEGNWTPSALELIVELNAKDLGYTSSQAMIEKLGLVHNSKEVAGYSLTEIHCLFEKYAEKILEIANEMVKSESK